MCAWTPTPIRPGTGPTVESQSPALALQILGSPVVVALPGSVRNGSGEARGCSGSAGLRRAWPIRAWSPCRLPPRRPPSELASNPHPTPHPSSTLVHTPVLSHLLHRTSSFFVAARDGVLASRSSGHEWLRSVHRVPRYGREFALPCFPPSSPAPDSFSIYLVAC